MLVDSPEAVQREYQRQVAALQAQLRAQGIEQ